MKKNAVIRNKLQQDIDDLVTKADISPEEKQAVLVAALQDFQETVGQPKNAVHLNEQQTQYCALQTFGRALGNSTKSAIVILLSNTVVRVLQITNPNCPGAGDELRESAPFAFMDWMKAEGIATTMSLGDFLSVLEAKGSGEVH